MIHFVSGVDTDAGKSIATGWLARTWLDAGRRVATLKLAQTGNVGSSEDIARHRAMMGVGPLPEDAEGLTAPYIFPHPCSPDLAARLAGAEIDPGQFSRRPTGRQTVPYINKATVRSIPHGQSVNTNTSIQVSKIKRGYFMTVPRTLAKDLSFDASKSSPIHSSSHG